MERKASHYVAALKAEHQRGKKQEIDMVLKVTPPRPYQIQSQPEVYFTNPQGDSQSNQVYNEDYLTVAKYIFVV